MTKIDILSKYSDMVFELASRLPRHERAARLTKLIYKRSSSSLSERLHKIGLTIKRLLDGVQLPFSRTAAYPELKIRN